MNRPRRGPPPGRGPPKGAESAVTGLPASNARVVTLTELAALLKAAADGERLDYTIVLHTRGDR